MNSQIFPDILEISPSYYFTLSLMAVLLQKNLKYKTLYSNNILAIFFTLCTISIFFNMRLAEISLFISLFYLIIFVPQFVSLTLIRMIAWNLLILSSIVFLKMSFFTIDTDMVDANISSRGINRISAIRGNSNTLAFYYCMCLFFIKQSGFSTYKHIVLNFIILVGIFFTGSRSGIFVGLVSLIYVLKNINIKILPAIIFGLGVLMYFIFNLYEDYINILIELTESELIGGAETSRTTILLKYFNATSDQNFSLLYGYNEYFQTKFGNIIHNDPLIIASHNTFMQVFLKYGLFSFFSFFIYFLVNSQFKNWRVNFLIFFIPFLFTVGLEGNKIFYIALIVLGMHNKNFNKFQYETL